MIALLLTLAANLDVTGPVCVDAAHVSRALDAIGGLDPAEQVRVTVTPKDENNLDLEIFIATIGAPTLTRTTPLRAVECKDVPDLVVVLVTSMRRERSEAIEKEKKKFVSDTWRPAPAPRRVARPRVEDVPVYTTEAWGPCSGPPSLGAL